MLAQPPVLGVVFAKCEDYATEGCCVFQVRIHGRGGQGVVTAAELLAQAAFDEHKFAQAFPSFGSERTGAPVTSFCRISNNPIRVREPIIAPDALIIQDATLLHQVDVFSGINANAFVLINSSLNLFDLGIDNLLSDPKLVITVPATEIALEHLGRPLPNAVLLGAFSALTKKITLIAVTDAITDKFPAKVAADNCRAATFAYEFVQNVMIDLDSGRLNA